MGTCVFRIRIIDHPLLSGGRSSCRSSFTISGRLDLRLQALLLCICSNSPSVYRCVLAQLGSRLKACTTLVCSRLQLCSGANLVLSTAAEPTCMGSDACVGDLCDQCDQHRIIDCCLLQLSGQFLDSSIDASAVACLRAPPMNRRDCRED